MNCTWTSSWRSIPGRANGRIDEHGSSPSHPFFLEPEDWLEGAGACDAATSESLARRHIVVDSPSKLALAVEVKRAKSQEGRPACCITPTGEYDSDSYQSRNGVKKWTPWTRLSKAC